MIEFLTEGLVLDNKIKFKNLPGVDKHYIYDTFKDEYNKTFNEDLQYQDIKATFVDFIYTKVYYIDKNGNKYYIYHKNDYGRRVQSPYFWKNYKRHQNQEKPETAIKREKTNYKQYKRNKETQHTDFKTVGRGRKDPKKKYFEEQSKD